MIHRSAAREVSGLRSESTRIGQGLDSSQKKLNGSVASTCSIAREFVAGKLHLIEGQSTLGTPVSLEARAGEGAAVIFWMIRDVELFARISKRQTVSRSLQLRSIYRRCRSGSDSL